MGYLTNAIIIMLCISAMIYISNVAINEANPQNDYEWMKCTDLISSKLGTCNPTNPNDANLDTSDTTLSGALLEPEQAPSDPLTTITTNIVNAITSAWKWVTSPISFGFSIIKAIFITPVKALEVAGIPAGITFTIGGILLAMIIFWFSDWFKGGQA